MKWLWWGAAGVLAYLFVWPWIRPSIDDIWTGKVKQ